MQQAGRRNPRFTSAKSPRKLRKGTREMPYFPSQILYPRIYLFPPPTSFFPFINRPTSSHRLNIFKEILYATNFAIFARSYRDEKGKLYPERSG